MSRRVLWLLGATLFIGFGLAQLPALADMRDGGTSVFAFEFALTTERAREMLDGWGRAGADAAQTHLLLDFGYLAGYGLLLWLAATAAGRPRLALLGPAAAGFDALENTALLLVAEGHTGQPWPALGAGLATAKFAAAAAVLAGTAAALVRRRRLR